MYWLISGIFVPFTSGGVDFVLFGKNILEDILYLRQYWFIPCLFISVILVHGLHRICFYLCKRERVSDVGLIILSVFCLILSYIKHGSMILQIGQVLVAIPFIALGIIMAPLCNRLYAEGAYNKKRVLNVMAFTGLCGFGMVSFVILNFLFADGANFAMYLDEYGKYYYAFPGAICGIFMMIGINWICCFFNSNRYLERLILFLSKYSLVIFPVHLWGVTAGKWVIRNFGVNNWVMKFAINIAVISALLSVIKYLVVRFPILNGQRK